MNKTMGLTGLLLAAALGAGCATGSSLTLEQPHKKKSFLGTVNGYEVMFTEWGYFSKENLFSSMSLAKFIDPIKDRTLTECIYIEDYNGDGAIDSVKIDDYTKNFSGRFEKKDSRVETQEVIGAYQKVYDDNKAIILSLYTKQLKE